MRKPGAAFCVFRSIMAALAAAVVLGALVCPAATLEAGLLCGRQAHQHEDVCFSVQEILRCQASPHVHSDSCRDGEGMWTCGSAEHLLHLHEKQCYDNNNLLRCPLPETVLHTHSAGCWQLTADREPEISCGKPEIIAHVHILTCQEDGKWICGQLQPEFHSHHSGCYETESTLTCSKEEHIHNATCFAAGEELLEGSYAQKANGSPQASQADVPVVSGDGITFGLFNYSLDINKDASGNWRGISDWFAFRNSRLTAGETPSESVLIPAPNINELHDADGFTATHATVERLLKNGMPVLDLSRNADGTARDDPGRSPEERSLSYLFGGKTDHAVTAYTPGNTILQKQGSRYFYDSRQNAVDYDADANLFRVRSYPERNSTTAGYGTDYADFLPFSYTGGEPIHDPATEDTPYHILTDDTDYWFGMRMQVNFYQSRDGQMGEENMVFRFSGDDDVWVFVDDVLVLDLGGTHGTVDGSIDFATGQVLQYLSWGGANATEEEKTKGSSTSFPTTLRACFDAAGKAPNGGWNEDGTTFADYTGHTLTFFYLERGAAVANCKMDFLLPTLPDKSLTVTKELTADGEVGDFLRETLPYRFRVVKAENPRELYLMPGMTYTLLENGTPRGTGAVEADGTFPLKAGQSAQFTDMLVKGGGAKAYVVQEILPDVLTGQYAGVEYSVSGAGGTTKTEEGPTQDFTAFATETLSSEQTQVVTFRNKVDVTRLSRLEIAKEKAEGSVFPEEAVFPIQVRLGGELLPVGSEYKIGQESYFVTRPGIIPLKIGQRAVLEGILSGTAYEITELEGESSWRPSYSGAVIPEGTVSCMPLGATGEFPLNSTVQITVTNASFDYSLPIPLRKTALYHQGAAEFRFRIQRVLPLENGGWEEQEELPGTTITVTDDLPADRALQLGFQNRETGTHYFKVWEQPGQGNFLYDDTFYILEVSAGEDCARITAILKNGTDDLPEDSVLTFVNRRTGSVLITKTTVGGDAREDFAFIARVMLAGEPCILPGEEEIIRFSLAHGESRKLTGIPWGARVIIEEAPGANYIPSFYIEDGPEEQGTKAELTVEKDQTAVHFMNRSGYTLPQTGGRGTNLYTMGGLMQMAVAILLMYIQKKRDRKSRKAA